MRALAALALAAWLGGCATNAGPSSGATIAILALYLVAASQVEGIAPPPPPLDAGRKVSEVDCTKPIADWSANLRCR
ncbi:MAG: hypothetical protein ACREVQ_14100 [Burkholderiales bacterium]